MHHGLLYLNARRCIFSQTLHTGCSYPLDLNILLPSINDNHHRIARAVDKKRDDIGGSMLLLTQYAIMP